MKRIYKTAFGVMLCGAVLASACACGFSGGEDINLDIDLSQKIELSVLMPNSGYDDSYINEDDNAKKVQELTGYSVKYSQLPAASASTQLNLLLTDHTKFNAMKLTKNQFADLIKDDVLCDLTPAIDKFGGVLKEVISKESWETVTVNGKIYGIPERSSSDNIQYPIVFRQDWLDELNLGMPTTTAELRTVLQTIKTEKEVIPLTFDKYTPVVWPIAASFGIYADWQEYEVNGTKKVLYYMEAPGYKEYVDYMADLYNDGLIDAEVPTLDGATAISNFTTQKAGAVATSIWSVSAIVAGLESSHVISSVEANAVNGLPNTLAYLRALNNADGEEHANRLGGCPYVTCVPFYMAENAGYVIDWCNQKVTDTEEAHNFREIVLGTENYHWTQNPSGDYLPVSENFAEKDTASYYLTGSNETVYTQYWLARVRKQAELYRAWDLMMDDADEVGVYNALDFAPPLSDYASKRAIIELYAQDQFFVMLKTDKGTGNLESYLTKWRNDGGTVSTTEINKWYQSKK